MQLVQIFVFLFIFDKICTINTCPDVCKCRNNGKDVICKNGNLKTIPRNLQLNVEILDLTKNVLNNLTTKSFFHISNLRVLKLDHCQINYINDGAFDGLDYLKRLFLTNNNLDNLPKNTFKGLNSLKHVYLGNNKFQNVPPISCGSVTKINLDGNQISNAHIPESFKQNIQLKTLVLTNNRIGSLNEGDFENLASIELETLFLKNNNLDKLNENSFKPLRSHLSHLELEGNSLLTSKQIEDSLRVFSGISRLLSLNLRRTGLTSISSNFFKPLCKTRLQRINIGDNSKLNLIDIDSFQDLDNVFDLVADKCQISSSNIKFAAMKTLRKIDLSHNKFTECPHSLPNSLLSVDLSHNVITMILARDFKGLSILMSLNIANNAITNIQEDSFSDLAHLKILDLSHNKLETIHSRIFFSMTSLTRLDIHQQLPCLRHISADSFHLPNLLTMNLNDNCLNLSSSDYPLFNGCPRLSHLSIRSNTIDYLPSRTFIGCTNLSILDLSHNHIRGWSPLTFVTIKSTLVTLYLSSNQLQSLSTLSTLSNYLPMNFNKLQNVSLDNNHWNCVCESISWLIGHRDFIDNKDKVLCEKPPDKAMNKLFNIKEMMDCHVTRIRPGQVVVLPVQSNLKVTIIIVSSLVSVFIGILFFLIRRKFRHRCEKLIQNRYRRLKPEFTVPERWQFDNPLLDDEMLDSGVNRLVFDESVSNLAVVAAVDGDQDLIDRVESRSSESIDDHIFLTTAQVGDFGKIDVRVVTDLGDSEALVAVRDCWVLAIDYPFVGDTLVEKIVAVRLRRSPRPDHPEDGTYVLHTSGYDEDNPICTMVGHNHIIRYNPEEVSDAFYKMYDQ